MLETILFQYCLLFINTSYLCKEGYKCVEFNIFNSSVASFIQLDVSRKNILLKSQNNNIKDSLGSTIQSAENCKGFSETARQIPEKEDSKF